MLTAGWGLGAALSRRGVGLASRRLLADAVTPKDKAEIEAMTKVDKVVVFMKGTPEEPMCGFSRAVVKILDIHGLSFSAVNVLEDQSVREGVKAYSEWPTIPQIYLDGDFVGGCDIMIQMHQSGELVETLKAHGITSRLADQPPAKDA